MRIALVLFGLVLVLVGCASPNVRLEAEDARLTGVEVATTQPARPSAGKYVTGIDAADDAIVFRPALRPGLYDATLGYRTPSGRKGFTVRVDDRQFESIFTESRDDFARHRLGLIELAADSEIAILRGWGYYDVDYLELRRIEKPLPPVRPPAKLVDPHATPETKRLMQYLVDMHGVKMLSGGYGEKESDYVYEVTGERPAILGLDMMECSPSRREHGADPGELMQDAIRLHRAGHIITISWHWNAPSGLLDRVIEREDGQRIDARWYKGFNTIATTFNVEAALKNPNSREYQLLLRDIDVIAEELKTLQAARVPVLWRPLHEADGRWFWWGAKGPEPFKQLWRLMHDRMTNRHQLHNLIWVYTGTQLMEWYPGDDMVDIFGIDAYTPRSDPLSGPWVILEDRFAGKTLVAISEYGGVPDVQAMRRFGCWYSYFVAWGGAEGPAKVTKEELAKAYKYWGLANLDDLPKWNR